MVRISVAQRTSPTYSSSWRELCSAICVRRSDEAWLMCILTACISELSVVVVSVVILNELETNLQRTLELYVRAE